MPASDRRLITASERRLLTVLFTDIVGSTDLAVEMGDARWRELIARHHRIVRGALKRFGGREIDTAGDGFFATFERPAQAIRCAAAIVEMVREIGIEIRAGLHLGEVEVAGKNVGGVAVHTGARVLSASDPGEVLVTATLRELVSGSGLEFVDRGRHTLKGVPDTWQLFGLAAVDGRPLELVSEPPTAAERRAAIAAPTILRRGRMRAAIAAGALLLAIGVTIAIAVRPAQIGRGPIAFVPPLGSVIRVDAVEGSIEHTTPDVVVAHGGGNPKIAVGEGGVWVRSNSLVHLDPITGIEERQEPLIETTGDPRADRGVEVGFQAVWIGGMQDRGIARLQSWDPATDDRRPDIEIPSSVVLTDVALGYGAVWITFRDGRLVEVDPNTRRPVDETPVDGSPDGVITGAGGIWILDVINETLTRFDPHSLRPSPSVQVSSGILAMAADDERVWLLEAGGNVVLPIAADGTKLRPIPIGDEPSGIAVGLGSVWVSDESGVVYKIDPITFRVTSIDPGGHLTAIAVDEESGSLWFTVGGD